MKDLPKSVLLVSFDDAGLYTHITHEEGIKIMKKSLNHRVGEEVGEVYHQLLGAALEIKFTPIYANLFMGGLGKRIFENTNFNQFYGIDI